MEHSKLKIEELEGVTVVTFLDPLIAASNSMTGIWDILFRLILPEAGTRLVLDFSQVRFLSSTALGGLMRVSQKVRASGGKMRFCQVAPAVMDILKLTRMDKVIEICASQAEARASL
ncbi:MAG: STAS domain-containing protein [Planctomycetia bacterium]